MLKTQIAFSSRQLLNQKWIPVITSLKLKESDGIIYDPGKLEFYNNQFDNKEEAIEFAENLVKKAVANLKKK